MFRLTDRDLHFRVWIHQSIETVYSIRQCWNRFGSVFKTLVSFRFNFSKTRIDPDTGIHCYSNPIRHQTLCWFSWHVIAKMVCSLTQNGLEKSSNRYLNALCVTPTRKYNRTKNLNTLSRMTKRRSSHFENYFWSTISHQQVDKSVSPTMKLANRINQYS